MMKKGALLILYVLICSWFTYGLARELASNVHSSDVTPAWSSSWSWSTPGGSWSTSPGGSWSWSTSPGGSWSWSRSTPGGSWSWSIPGRSWSWSTPIWGSAGSPPVPAPVKDSDKCGCYIQKINACVYELYNSANANTKISPDCCSVVEEVQDDCVGIAVINPYYVPTIKAHCASKATPPTATKAAIKA